jgi:hypothetical protein
MKPYDSRFNRLLLSKFTVQNDDGNGVVIAALGQPR